MDTSFRSNAQGQCTHSARTSLGCDQMNTYHQNIFPLIPMGVLAPGSAHRDNLQKVPPPCWTKIHWLWLCYCMIMIFLCPVTIISIINYNKLRWDYLIQIQPYINKGYFITMEFPTSVDVSFLEKVYFPQTFGNHCTHIPSKEAIIECIECSGTVNHKI